MCTRHRSIHLPWAALLSLGLLFVISSTIVIRTLDGHTFANYNPKSHIESKVVSGIKRERECQAHPPSSAESSTHGS